jgi:DNA (cytosine-5)-methyltransferase 1
VQPDKYEPTVLSLFSGVGGFDLGLERGGMRTVYQCEWDKHATNILNRHWPDVPKWGDVSTLTADTILAHTDTVDVVAWGSPCQDLSVAGRRAGLEGARSGLFHEGIRIIRELREATNGRYPRVSVWENVAGALNSNKGADFGVILNEMAAAGALVQEWRLLDAQYFGVPQRRRRVFLVSVFDPAIADRCPDPLLPLGEGVSRNGGKDGHHTFYTSQGRQDRYTSGICTSLKTAGVACVVGVDTPPRRLTPLECERLMGWPDNWTDGQADSHRYKQCGNGVASPVAEWIAQHITPLL